MKSGSRELPKTSNGRSGELNKMGAEHGRSDLCGRDGLSAVRSGAAGGVVPADGASSASAPLCGLIPRPSALWPLILAFAFAAIMAIGFQDEARADGPRIDFATAFEEIEADRIQIEPREIEHAIQAKPAMRKVRVYVLPEGQCVPCKNQKAAFANVAQVADVEYVVGGPSWVAGYPTIHVVDVNRVVSWEHNQYAYGPGGVVSVDGLREVLKRNPPEGVVGLGSITVGTIIGKQAVKDLIQYSASATGQASGTATISFEGHGHQAIKIKEGVEIRVRDPLVIRYRWSASKVELAFTPVTSVSLKAGGANTAIDGVSADIDKLTIDLPGWLTPDLKVRLQ